MNDALKNFLFIDQLKIMGYGESDTSGCWIKFQLTPELLEMVRGRKGEMVEVAARLIDNSGEYIPPNKKPKIYADAAPKTMGELYNQEAIESSGEHGKYWQGLIRLGVFNAPPVLEAIGADKNFQAWVRKQPSCLSKDADWDEESGELRNEYCHVRRVSEGAGTGIKPKYFGVPMTHEEHNYQHQYGELVTLTERRPKKGADPAQWNVKTAKAWFENKAAQHRMEWATTALIRQLGYKRRRDCPPEEVKSWIKMHKLERFFPKDKA